MAFNKVFVVSGIDAKGRDFIGTAQIGGGDMTAEQLAEHYQRHNAFAGAKEVSIQETDLSPAASLREAVKTRPKFQHLMKRLQPKADAPQTPKIKIEEPIVTKTSEAISISGGDNVPNDSEGSVSVNPNAGPRLIDPGGMKDGSIVHDPRQNLPEPMASTPLEPADSSEGDSNESKRAKGKSGPPPHPAHKKPS